MLVRQFARRQVGFLCPSTAVVARRLLQSASTSSSHSQCIVTTTHRVHALAYVGRDCRGFASKASSGKRDVKGKKHCSVLTDDEAGEVINVEALKTHLDRSVERLRNDFVHTLTVRTSVGSLESLVVSFDGQKYPLNEIAQVVRKNPGLAIINVAAMPTATSSVMEAITKSGMNLNPRQEGTTISVPLPQVTREHREALVKNAKSLFVRAKDELKKTQNKYIKEAKEKKSTVSDDLIFSVQQHVTAMTNHRVAEAETMLKKKQAELLG